MVRVQAKAWQMQDCMWMFQSSPDVEADVEIMLELRGETDSDTKHVEKIVIAGQSMEKGVAAESFDRLRELMSTVKEGVSPFVCT